MANFCGARAGARWASADGGACSAAGNIVLAARCAPPFPTSRNARASPSPVPPASRGPQKHTLRSDSRTVSPLVPTTIVEGREQGKESMYNHALLGSSQATDVRIPRFRQITYRLLVGNRQEGGRGKKCPKMVMSAVLCTGNPQTKWTVLPRDDEPALEQK